MSQVAFPTDQNDPVIWVHADSTASLRTFVTIARKIEDSAIAASFLITADADLIGPIHAGANVTLSEVPKPRDLRGFFNAWSPVLGIWIGAPLDAKALKTAFACQVPMILMNAGEDVALSSEGYFRRRAVQKLLPKFRIIFAENHISGGICMRHGAAETAIDVAGLLSESAMALPCNIDDLDALAACVTGREVWLAAEVPMAELDTVLEAHETLRSANRRLLLLLNTSQLESEETLAIDLAAKGWRVAVRGKGDQITEQTQIYISNGSAEMGLWYRLAPISYIGGSFTRDGESADPMHAAALGSAILFGPHTAPHKGAFDQLMEQSPAAATQVISTNTMSRAVEALLAPHHAAEQASSAWEYVSRGAALTDNVISLIEEAVDQAEVPHA